MVGFITQTLPRVPAIENKISFTSKRDLFKYPLCSFSEIVVVTDISPVFLFMFSTLIKLTIPELLLSRGVVPFVISAAISLSLRCSQT